MSVSGVYQIRNLVNGSRYIGSAVNFGKRWYAHRRMLLLGTHWSKHLQAAWSKHGEANFVFSPILICDKNNVLTYEQIAIDAMRPEYNKCSVAGSTLGIKYSAESLARLSVAHSTASLSKETREKMSASQSLRRHSLETRAKISAVTRGRKLSPEECERRSKRMLGHVTTEETRKKIAAALKGRKLPPERVAKIAISSTGRKHSAETKERMSLAKLGNKFCLGRVLSAETRAKQSAAQLARKNLRRRSG